MKREEINKLQIYLRKTFNNNNISIVPRADKSEDSAEFQINNEFFGIVFKDTEEGETTFHLEMSIIEEDLPLLENQIHELSIPMIEHEQ